MNDHVTYLFDNQLLVHIQTIRKIEGGPKASFGTVYQSRNHDFFAFGPTSSLRTGPKVAFRTALKVNRQRDSIT